MLPHGGRPRGLRQIAGRVDQGHVGERLGKIAQQSPGLSGRILPPAAPRRWPGRRSLSKCRRASSVRPCRTRLSTYQKLHARKAPSPGGRPSISARVRITPDQAVLRCNVRSIAATVPSIRGSSAGRNPTSGIIEQGGVRVFRRRSIARRCFAGDRSPGCRLLRGPWRGLFASSRPGPSSRLCSTALMARSKATQAMTFEWVKWRGWPRISQIPSSGFRHAGLQEFEEFQLHLPGVFVGLQSLAAGQLQGVHHLADHVELELRGSGVADADRAALFIARQPGDLPFGNAAFAGQAIEDLDLPRVAGHGPQQPVAPLAGFVVVSAADHGVEREGGVAEPAVAVVPVAGAAELLRQRGGGRGHHAPGRCVGQRFQRDQRADDGIAPRPVDGASVGPLPPPRLGIGQFLVGRHHPAQGPVGRVPGEREGNPLVGGRR